jgi:hypothetical protein
VEIPDSRTYELEALSITIPEGARFELRAAEGKRPVLHLKNNLTIVGGSGSSFEINGLVIAGNCLKADGKLNRLTLRHMTLVPLHATPSLRTTQATENLVVAANTCEV